MSEAQKLPTWIKAQIIAAAFPIAAGISAYSHVGQHYNAIQQASPQLDARSTARLAWIAANHDAEIFYTPSLLGQKNKTVSELELKSSGLTASHEITTALASTGLHYK